VRTWFGSAVFMFFFFASIVVFGFAALVARLFGYRASYAIAVLWVRCMLGLLRICCGLDYRVTGLGNLPAENCVIMMKHSSAWETLAQLTLFPHQTWVLKRELLWAPVFGWVLAGLKPIAIDRASGRKAVEQVIRQGGERLRDGLWIVIFPEGTRVRAGTTKRYGISGPLLAESAGRPIVPVAHNAGAFWPRRGFRKYPGTIDVVIGEPVRTGGRDPRSVNDEIQSWIETTIGGMG